MATYRYRRENLSVLAGNQPLTGFPEGDFCVIEQGEDGVLAALALTLVGVSLGVANQLELRLPPPGGQLDRFGGVGEIVVNRAPRLLAIHQEIDPIVAPGRSADR